MEKANQMLWPKIALAVGIVSSISFGAAQIYCDHRILELQVFYGDEAKSRSAVFKTNALSTRDSSTVDAILKAKWSSNGSWAEIKNYKLAIVSIPDTQDCKTDRPDTAFFDSKCYVYNQGPTTAEVSPRFLLLISKLVSVEDKNKMFSSAPCQKKLKYAMEEESRPKPEDGD